MRTMYQLGDGSGRDFREVQLFIKSRLKQIWNKDNNPIVIDAAVASGKSFISRMIQLEHGGAIITPQNTLLRQYVKDYPALNYWYGKHHFKCKNHEPRSCGYIVDEMKFAPCEGCPFVKNRAAAAQGEPTVFNPLSLYFLRRKYPEMPHFPVVIVDEAHAVLTMIMHMSGKEFDVSEHPNPENLLQGYNLVPWLKARADFAKEQMDIYVSTGEDDKAMRWEKKYARYLPVIQGVEEDEASYFITLNPERTKLMVKPIEVPQSIVKQLFGDSRLVLMSGTLFEPDIKELVGDREYHRISPPNPIPAENRPIYFRPVTYPVNKNTDMADLANDIEKIIDEFGKGQRTIVHLPYEWAPIVAKSMVRPVITHTKETKAKALEQYKNTEGAILFACGMAEGIDLKDDLCRLNIIPKLLWPNLGDSYVQKKKGIPNKGDVWYDLEVLKTVIQQTGRSTRTEKDWSNIVVMDPTFPKLILRTKKYLPNGFIDGIHWGQSAKTAD